MHMTASTVVYRRQDGTIGREVTINVDATIAILEGAGFIIVEIINGA
jgi:hypothetical protein